MCLGIPGQIIEITDAAARMAAVRVSGARRMVDLSLLDEDAVAPGDWVLVHAGLALSAIPEREALETLALLREMSEAFLGATPDAPPEDVTPAIMSVEASPSVGGERLAHES
ncbi:MAG TPA: HypC/HybG/HupF family hydrogenase formation chaperone [Ktedonobacterales bacterium]|nr:HypC/HybG/HupF family hydrogenase formation chaperone [Ktedonobacterales bacterium]